MDADLIYDRSIAPRSVRLNLTVPLNEREINLVEIGLRQVGLENQIKKLFAPNGPLAGKNMPQILSEIAEFLQSDNTINEVTRSRVMYQRSTHRPTQQNEQSDLEASMFVNLDGKTVAYLDLADLTNPENDMRIVVKSLKNQLRSGDWSDLQDRAFALSFNKEYEIPSKTGYKPVSFNGSVLFGIKADRTGLWPSMSLELSTQTPEKRVVQRIHSSPSLKFQVEANKVTVSLANDKMNILTASSQAYDIDVAGVERAVAVSSKKLETCSNHLSKALGVELCARLSGPKHLLRQEQPYFAPWNMEVTVSKSDSRMQGWEVSFELPKSGDRQPTYKFGFDTPRSSIKRNFAVQVQLLNEPVGIRAKIELPRRQVEGAVAYRITRNEVYSKVELALERNQKYSVEIGLKNKYAGKKSEWTPLLEIHQPGSQPTTLTGSVAIETGRRNQLSFNIHNNAQNDKKFVKGSIVRDGDIYGDLKMSTELQAELDEITFKLYGMADKKVSGSAHTDIKVDYQLPHSRKHSANFIGKIQNLSSGRTTKMNSFVELKMTQFPEKNIHIGWNIQHKPEEQMENELTIMWRDQMNDPRRKIHILQDSKFTGIRSGRTATSDNIVSIEVAPLSMKYEIKAFGHLERSDAPSYKLSFEVNDKVANKNVAASWEYRHTSISPLKMSIDASLLYPGRQLRYSDKIDEVSPNIFKGATQFQWAQEKKMTVEYVFKRRAESNSKIYELEADLKTPSMKLQHSGMMRMSPRDIEFTTKMNKEQGNIWDVAAHWTNDDKSALRFEVTGVEGKMEVSPFSAQKSLVFEVSGKSFSHYSNLALSRDSMSVSSKTMKDKKPIFFINSKMDQDVIAGPHDVEIRFQGPKSKTGEQKVKIHHEIRNGQAKGTVTYYIKNQEKASFESYASAKATSSDVQVAAGVTFKTEYKYQNLDGFHLGFEHRHQKSGNNRVKSESTIKGHLGQDLKARMTVEADKQGTMQAGQGTAKVIIEFPVYDFKHQEAEFAAEWNSQKARVTMKGVNNQNKTVRASGEVEHKNGRLFARMEGQSEIHRRNTEATLTADKHSIVLVAKSNDKEVIRAEAKANYNSPRDFNAAVQGKVMDSPMYQAAAEARPTGKQVRYNVIAKRNEKTYASGQLSLDYSNGYDAELKMETEPRKVKFALTSKVARDILRGPHKIEARAESDNWTRRTVRLAHAINNNQAKQNLAYLVGQSEKVNVDSAIYYLRQKESRATKHTTNMDVTVRVEGQSYSMKHAGALKVDRDAVEFDSKAVVQGKDAWEVDGVVSRSARSALNFKVSDVNGKLEVTPFAPTKVAKMDIRSHRYSHESNMEVTPRSWALKVTSKTMVNNQPIVNLDIVRVPEQPNRLVVESKWLDAKMDADMTKEPMTASLSYNGKTSDRTNLRAAVAASKNEITVTAEGKSRSINKISTSLKGRRSNSHAEMDLTVDESGRERFASHARYEMQDGFRGQLSLKKDGKDLASTRASINKRPANGPNEIEVTLGSDESYKANHESNNGKWTVSLTHSKAGSRKDFAELSGQLRMAGQSADMSIELNAELAEKHANIKSVNLKLTHQHNMVRKQFSSQSTAKASINKSSYDASVQTTFEPNSKMSLDMSAQTPLKGLEKQSANIEATWSRDSGNLQVRADSASGYLVKFQGTTNLDRERSVSAKVHVETPRRNFERQEAELNAQWSKANAKVTIAVTDAKARKIRVSGESDISSDSILARGQVESEFPQIKSSLIEVRGDRQSALVLVKSNNEELIRAEGKGQWANWNEFHGELKGKTRSSPQLVLTLSANKIGEQTKYQAVAKRNTETIAMVEATRELSENRKHNIELSLPVMKIKAALKSEVSRSAAHGPHHLQVDFEHPKYGKRSAQITHKIQDGRIKCSVLYSKNGQTKFNIEHAGTYTVEVRAGEKKLYMNADFEAKICKKTFKMHHSGNLRVTRNSLDFESKAELDGKTAWNTKGFFSRSQQSHLAIEAGEYQGELQLSPFEQDKFIKVDIRSPVGSHKSEGHYNARTNELRVVSKTHRKSQPVMDFEIERRPSGTAKINVESMWADYRIEYDVSKRPMTAFMTLTTKKYKPAVDMKVQASGDENAIELSGEYKSSHSYAGSLRVRRSSEEVQVEFDSKRNEKPLYSGRAVAARKADGIKANARIGQKESDVAQVTLSLSNRALTGPHEIEIQLAQNSQSIRMRHEILAGQLKATAIHMVNNNKRSFVEVTGKATGQLDNADVTLTFNGETHGKKIMNIASLQVSLNHRHSINRHGFDASSQLKGFINRKDNLQVKITSNLDTRSKAGLSVEVQTPFNEYKKQELEIQSNWAPQSMGVQGKLVNSAGQSVRVKGNSSFQSGRLVVKGNLKSEMRSIPSINVDGAADSQGFFLNVDKNEQRTLQVEGKVNSAQWSKVDASIKGKLNRGPMYSASLKGTYERPEASYEFVTREGDQELMAARANAQINSSDDWKTGFELTAMGSEMASFDLKKEQSKAGHRSYVASYSGLNVDPQEHRIHEADVEPLFRSIRKSIRGF